MKKILSLLVAVALLLAAMPAVLAKEKNPTKTPVKKVKATVKPKTTKKNASPKATARKMKSTATPKPKPSPTPTIEPRLFEEEIPDEIELETVAEKTSIKHVKGMDRMVNDATIYHPELSKMDESIRRYNEALDALAPHIPTFFYYAESSRSHPAQKEFPEDSEKYLYIKERLHADQVDHLKYSTFEQFCQYFYSTDHHWNFRGSYQGYLDVLRMLKGPGEVPLQPKETKVFPVIFYGSYCRNTKQYISQECFAVYLFENDLQLQVYVNDKRKANYDNEGNYLKGRFSTKLNVSHYGSYYGGLHAITEIENGSVEKGSLLVFTDSFCLPLEKLLAHHYSRVVFVILEYYERDLGKACSIKELVDRYQTDQILILANPSLFYREEMILP